MGVVLTEEPLVLFLSRAVRARIAPAVEQVAALAAMAALVTGGLGGRCAVIDDPEFVEVGDADHDLIEVRIVGDAVAVRPIGIGPDASPRRVGPDVADR